MRDPQTIVFVYTLIRMALAALQVLAYAVFVLLMVMLLWAVFAVEPGRGWSWPM